VPPLDPVVLTPVTQVQVMGSHVIWLKPQPSATQLQEVLPVDPCVPVLGLPVVGLLVPPVLVPPMLVPPMLVPTVLPPGPPVAWLDPVEPVVGVEPVLPDVAVGEPVPSLNDAQIPLITEHVCSAEHAAQAPP
jgi:hypothetical protein